MICVPGLQVPSDLTQHFFQTHQVGLRNPRHAKPVRVSLLPPMLSYVPHVAEGYGIRLFLTSCLRRRSPRQHIQIVAVHRIRLVIQPDICRTCHRVDRVHCG